MFNKFISDFWKLKKGERERDKNLIKILECNKGFFVIRIWLNMDLLIF